MPLSPLGFFPFACFTREPSRSKGICQSHRSDERELVGLCKAWSGERDGSRGDSRREGSSRNNHSAEVWNLEHKKTQPLDFAACSFQLSLALAPFPTSTPVSSPELLTYLFWTCVIAEVTFCLFWVERVHRAVPVQELVQKRAWRKWEEAGGGAG